MSDLEPAPNDIPGFKPIDPLEELELAWRIEQDHMPREICANCRWDPSTYRNLETGDAWCRACALGEGYPL